MSRDDIWKVGSFNIHAIGLIDRACIEYRRKLTESAMQMAANDAGRKQSAQVEYKHVEWVLGGSGGCAVRLHEGKLY